MADNLTKLQAQGKASNVVSSLSKEGRVPVDMGYVVGGKKKLFSMKASQVGAVVHIDDSVVYPLTPAPASSSFTGANRLDLVIPKGSAGRIKSAKLRFRCQNTDGANTVTPAVVHAWLDKVEWLADAGTKLLQTQYGLGLFLTTGFIPSERWACIAPLAGTSSSWGNNSAIATSATIDYYLELNNSVLNYGFINLKALDNDLILRLWTLPAVSSGTGTLAVNGIDLLVSHESSYSTDEMTQLKHMKDYIIADNFVDHVRIQYTSTVTAGANNDFSLRQLNGTCHMLAFYVDTSNNNVTNGLTTFTSLDTNNSGTVDLITPTGQSVLAGGNTLNLYDLRNSIDSKHMHNPNFLLNKAAYFIPFSHNCQRALDSGNIDGAMVFSGTEVTLRIKPNASFTTGTYVVNIIAFMGARLLQSNSKIWSESL